MFYPRWTLLLYFILFLQVICSLIFAAEIVRWCFVDNIQLSSIMAPILSAAANEDQAENAIWAVIQQMLFSALLKKC